MSIKLKLLKHVKLVFSANFPLLGILRENWHSLKFHEYILCHRTYSINTAALCSTLFPTIFKKFSFPYIVTLLQLFILFFSATIFCEEVAVSIFIWVCHEVNLTSFSLLREKRSYSLTHCNVVILSSFLFRELFHKCLKKWGVKM